MNTVPERALIIRKPWSEHILNGDKTWELRGKNTKIRDPVALIEGGSGKIVGMFNIDDCSSPLSREERVLAAKEGKILDCEIDEDMYTHVYAWKLSQVVRFENPVDYKHPSGAVIWVTMTDEDKSNMLKEIEKIEIKKALDSDNKKQYILKK